jgi:hypothetical protein
MLRTAVVSGVKVTLQWVLSSEMMFKIVFKTMQWAAKTE